MKRRFLSILLALLMVLSMLPTVFAPKTAVAEDAPAQPVDQEIVEGGAILHCFDWSFREIEDLLDEIKAAGYVAVQTSPVQEPKDYRYQGTVYYGSDQWWKLYQPLGFTIAPLRDGKPSSWLGTRGDLALLCAAAEEKGIYVIVDVVANHVANVQTGGYWQYDYDNDWYILDEQGNKISNVSDQVYPELQYSEYYHTYVEGVDDGGGENRFTMTQYQMGMPDLNTSNKFVQQQVYNLLAECVDCGVDGFRFDAAKHIELPGDSGCGSDFWPTILNGDNEDGNIPGIRNYAHVEYDRDLFIYGESLSGTSDMTWVKEFSTYMALTDSNYGDRMHEAVKEANAGKLGDGTYVRCSNPRNNVLWVESHDTYENGSTVGLTPEQIQHAWAIVGARANSTALFFARPNETMGRASSDETWCSKPVAEVNKFKNHFVGTQEYLHSDYNNKVAWIERGTNGVVISKLDGAGSVSLEVSRMKDGTYIDQVSGYTFTVAGGIISGNVGSTGVAVVYNANEKATDGINASTLYLVPDIWNKDGARFAMYVNDNDDHEAWVSMTADGDGVFKADVPTNYAWTNVIFVRMDGTTTENKWANKWNQTANLYPEPGCDTYTITGWDDGNGHSTGTWSRKGAAGYYLVGNMTNWKPSAAYQLELIEDSNPVEYTIMVDLAADAQFKVAYSADGKTIIDSDWFPSGMGNNYGQNGELSGAGRYTVRFRPNQDGGDGWFYGYILLNQTTEPTCEKVSLTLDGSIAMNFYMDLSGLTDAEKEASYMTFDISGAGTVSDARVPFDANRKNNDGTLYGFSCRVNALQMADKVTATFHYGGNDREVKQYSVEEYIIAWDGLGETKQIELVGDDLRDKIDNLIHALADYGHHVQAFLDEIKDWSLGNGADQYAPMDKFYTGHDAENDYDYDTILSDLYNEANDRDYRIYKELKDANITDVKFALVLDSETAIRVYFTPAEGFDGPVSMILDNAHETDLVRGSDGRYMVEITNIPAHKLGDKHTILVYTGDNCFSSTTQGYTEVVVCAMSYVCALLNSAAYANNTEAKEAVSALYKYWEAAKEYLGN